MADWTNSYDISVVPRRYLQRQWKKNKPHLPPSDSLPALRLCPNRPLFVCAQCGFANAWIPLCLWCKWTSAEATKQFEANLPRPRRLSAPPPRAVYAPKKTRQLPRRMSTESALSSGGPHTPKNERTLSSMPQFEGVPGITTVLGSLHRDICHNDRRLTVLDPHHAGAVNRHSAPALPVSLLNSHNVQKETVDGGGHRVVAETSITPPLPTISFLDVASPNTETEEQEHQSEGREVKRDSKRHRRRLPPLCVHSPTTRFRASCPTVERTELDDAPAMDSVVSVLMEASSVPRSRDSVDLSDPGPMQSTSSIASSQCSPKRGLRRTKNMTLFPRGSSLSPRSRSPLRESADICPTSAVESRQSHALSLTPSHDPDAPPVRLGHPSRPYYSAIRKDMSRPTSPAFSIATPRTPSPIPSQVECVSRGTKSLDYGDRSGGQYTRELRPMSLVLSGRPPTSPGTGSGCSLSGEMELRMNLARWRREHAPHEPGGYHFLETPKLGMKGRVKQLGKGLKALILGRSSFIAERRIS